MSDYFRTRHPFNTKLEFGTRLNSKIHLEKNPLVAYWAKRNSYLHQYIYTLKCLLCLMLTILQHMVRSFECKDIVTGGVNYFDNPCENNKVRRYMLNKSYSKKEACDGISSSKDSPEIYSKTDSAKKALMYRSDLKPVSSFLNDFNTYADSDGQVLPENSNESHEYCKTQERRVQHSLDQSSSSISVKHNAESKHVSEVEQTGNMSNNSSTEIHMEEPDSKSSSSISIMSIYKNKALDRIEGSDETGLDLYSLSNADLDCLGNTSFEMDDTFGWQETDATVASIRANESLENKLKEIFMSTYKKEAFNNHGVHQTEGSEETRLDLDSLRNAHCDRLGNTLPEPDDTFCWQEPDDTLASLRANDNLENKLKEIFQPTNFTNKHGTAFFQFADTLSNFNNPVQNNSVTHIEEDISEEELMQINSALTGSFLARDGHFGELLNRESIPKKIQRPDDADSRCRLNLSRGTSNDHSGGNRKQYLESGNTSNMFDDLCDTNFDVGTNHYCADKTPIGTTEFVCLENTNIMYDAMQLKEEQQFFCNPKIMDEHNVGLGVVSLKGILVETYQVEALGAEDKPQDVVSGAETAETSEVEGAAGAQGEDVGGDDTEGENQEGEGGDGEGGGESGGESGGEGGQDEAKSDEGNDYVLILLRGSLGPSFDEAIIDMMDVIQRLVEFIKELVKGSALQEEEGGSSEGDTDGGEKGDESGQEDAAEEGGEEGGAEGGDEGAEKGGEAGGAEAAGGEEQGGEEQGGSEAAGGEEQGGAEAEDQGGAESAEGEDQGGAEGGEEGGETGGEEGGAEGGEEGGEAGGEEEGAQDAEQGGEAGGEEGTAEGGAEEDAESAEPESEDDKDVQNEEQLQSEDNEDSTEEEEKEVANENLQE